MRISAPYILYVTADPACTAAIRFATILGPSQVQIINAHALPRPYPTWLVGVPTLIATTRPGPALTGSSVVSWLEQAVMAAQSSMVATNPGQRYPSHIQPQQRPPRTDYGRGAIMAPTLSNKQQLDTLFESEFDKQESRTMTRAALSGSVINPQTHTLNAVEMTKPGNKGSVGFEFVRPSNGGWVSDVSPGEVLTM